MLRRHGLTDAQWELIRDLLPGKACDPGRTAGDIRTEGGRIMAGDVGKGNRQESIARRSGSVEEGVLYSEDEVSFLKAVEEFKRRGKFRFHTHVDLYRLAKRHLEGAGEREK